MSDQVPPESPSPYPRPSDVGSPSMIGAPTAEEKTQALLVWVLCLVAWFVPALVFFLIAKEKPYVYRHAALCLTANIVGFVVYIASFIIAIVTLGIGALLFPVIGVLFLVLIVMGAVAANKGEQFNPPVISDLTQKIFKV